MANQVVFVSDHAARGFLEPLPAIVGDSQSEFVFSVADDVLADLFAADAGPLELEDALALTYLRKSALALRDQDLLLAFVDRPLRSTPHLFDNLFMAGSNLTEPPPRVGIVSTTFIRQNILRTDPMYLTQRHAFYHLVVCGLLGAFLDMTAHDDRGCLMDFNNHRPNIQRKIDVGYSFCTACTFYVRRHLLGEAIFRICSALKARGSLDIVGVRPQPIFDFRLLNTCGHSSQTEAFEALCAEVYSRSSEPGTVYHVKAPDGGVDILLQRGGQTFALQCKFFIDAFGTSQLRQIKESYQSAVAKHQNLDGYFVAIPRLLTKKEHEAVRALAVLAGPHISVIDRDALISMVSREPDLARRYFG